MAERATTGATRGVVDGDPSRRVGAAAPTMRLAVVSLAAGGDGVGRADDGRTIFVPRTAPGDVVEVALDPAGARRRWARGTPVRWLERSADRITPRCTHFTGDRCGGCQWQHLPLAHQRAAKGAIVADALQRIGGRAVGDVRVEGAPDDGFGYRRTITLTVRGDGDARRAGLRPFDDPDAIFPLTCCHLVRASVDAAWQVLRGRLHLLPRIGDGARAAGRARPRGAGRSRAGARPELRLTIRTFDSASAEARRVRDDASDVAPAVAVAPVALTVRGGRRWRAEEVAALAAAVPGCERIAWEPTDAPLRTVWPVGATSREGAEPARDARVTASAYVTDERAAASSFVQVNADVAAHLAAHVTETVAQAVPDGATGTLLDAYAGTGALGVAFAARGWQVRIVERDPDAAAVAAARLAALGEPHARADVTVAAVEAALDRIDGADVVVVNPPRTGLHEAVTHALDRAAAGTRRLVYVSCDPATLARDLARLPAWRLTSVTAFDMFPQTAHVETVCILEPEGP